MKFNYFGLFDPSGKSEYVNNNISKNSEIGQHIPMINTLLPERSKLHEIHEEWLKDNCIDFVSDSELAVTFVTEGAGYKNSVGYYIYNTSNPPTTIDHIIECYFIFPNSSLQGKGGSLQTGDRIKLASEFSRSVSSEGLNIVTPTSYNFKSGSSVGFILYPNGWRNYGVEKYIVPYTSFSAHNPERHYKLKYHTACLKIPQTDILLLAFEDIMRERSACDHDFNDCVLCLETDIESVANGFVDLDELEAEKNDELVPEEKTFGYKKIFSALEDGNIVECVATLYIPASSKIAKKDDFILRLMTDRAYVKSIIVVPPQTNIATTRKNVSLFLSSGYSWHDPSFIYETGKYTETELDKDSRKGIHFFRSYDEARRYNFSPYFDS